MNRKRIWGRCVCRRSLDAYKRTQRGFSNRGPLFPSLFPSFWSLTASTVWTNSVDLFRFTAKWHVGALADNANMQVSYCILQGSDVLVVFTW